MCSRVARRRSCLRACDLRVATCRPGSADIASPRFLECRYTMILQFAEGPMQPLPLRPGPRPATTPGLPHSQIDQQPTGEGIRRRLAERVFALPRVSEGPTRISVPGARALLLARAAARGPAEA